MATKAKDAVRPLASNKQGAARLPRPGDRARRASPLSGTEVKAVRTGKVQLKDSFVEFRDGQAWLVGAHISPYSHGNRENHLPDRDRRLLLKRRQIERLFGRTQPRA